MVRFLYILILMNSLANSVSATYIIELKASVAYKRILNNFETAILLNEPFTVKVHSVTPLYRLTCTDQQADWMNFNLRLNETNFYTSPKEYVLKETMNGIWKCNLYYSPDINENNSIIFEINVDVIHPNTHQHSGFNKQLQGSYGINVPLKAYQQSTGNRPQMNTPDMAWIYHNYPDLLEASVYPHNISMPKNSTQNNKETINQNYEGTKRQNQHSNDNKTDIDNKVQEGTPEANIIAKDNSKTILVIVLVVVAVIGIAIGAIASAVCKKICCRKSSTDEPRAIEDNTSPTYEEPHSTTSGAPAVDIANRPPYPLPFEEREENKKYIHYDTPYDHRFMSRMPRRQMFVQKM